MLAVAPLSLPCGDRAGGGVEKVGGVGGIRERGVERVERVTG